MSQVTFTNDDNVVISLLNHPESESFKPFLNQNAQKYIYKII